jgi:hypothetical protein
MKAWLRLGLIMAVLLAALVALRLFPGSSNEPTPVESIADAPGPVDPGPQTAPVAAVEPLTLDALGAPDDPLPASLQVLPTGELIQSDSGAETLARQIIEGRPDALPALITALQASGIGIVGPENAVLAKPAEPWQGIVMQRWEVRLTAAMGLPGRSVTLALPDLAAFLVAAIPELKGAPLEQLIVQDLRGLAESPVPTKRFFGRFIAALGRHAVSHVPYDLLADVNPQTIQLSGLQVSLLLRRLAIDILTLTGGDAPAQSPTPAKKTASFLGTLDAWIVPTAHAQGHVPTAHAQGQTPCAMSERTQTIMDVASVGSSLVWGGFEVGDLGMRGVMERMGMNRVSRAASIASTLLAYAQFISTYAALEAEVTMENAPLERTKKATPQTGERKELTAIVRMNVGNAEMLNCFRAMLIAVGLDFSVPNNGPVKGARASWYGVDGFDLSAAALHGGSEAIVQFVTTGTGAASAIRDAVTGDDGKLQVGVEGRGQLRSFGESASRVGKSARVRLDVALRGADLFGDVQEATGTAASGLVGLLTVPISMLYRAQWASVGHYTFPVTDWREGPGRWTGTITQTDTEITLTSSEGPDGGHTGQTTNTEIVEITITDTTSEELSGGIGVRATLQARASGKASKQSTGSGWGTKGCGSQNLRLTSSSRSVSSGSGQGDASIEVSLGDDGAYVVFASTAGVKMTMTGENSSVAQRVGSYCRIEDHSETWAHVPHEATLASGSVGVMGRVDLRTPYILQGTKSLEIPAERIDSQTTRRKSLTTTWNLRRN